MDYTPSVSELSADVFRGWLGATFRLHFAAPLLHIRSACASVRAWFCHAKSPVEDASAGHVSVVDEITCHASGRPTLTTRLAQGTQAEILKAKLQVCHLSTGDLLREAAKNGTQLGKQAKPLMDAGKVNSSDSAQTRLSLP